MSEDYLWDGSGQPEPDIAKLESVLGKLRWDESSLQVPVEKRLNWWQLRPVWAIAAATVLVLALGSILFVRHQLEPLTSWQLSFAGQKPHPVRSGQVIETDAKQATLESESIGEVDIDPNSRLRMLSVHEGEHRLALDHGTIHALIWAPPTQFVVDTPAAKAVDLGCEYTLSVVKDGEGFLTVQTGWVAFQWKGIESFIPEGAACTTRMGHGPDTPYFLDAPETLTKSLTEFDLTGNTQALARVLMTARPHDGLTLWHLLERTQGTQREQVYERFAELVKLPPTVTRESILRGESKSMDAAWDALKLGDTSWWREWKRNW